MLLSLFSDDPCTMFLWYFALKSLSKIIKGSYLLPVLPVMFSIVIHPNVRRWMSFLFPVSSAYLVLCLHFSVTWISPICDVLVVFFLFVCFFVCLFIYSTHITLFTSIECNLPVFHQLLTVAKLIYNLSYLA